MKLLFRRVRNVVKVVIGKANAVSVNKKRTETPYYCPVCKTENVYFNHLPFYYFSELDKNQYIHSIFQTETINIEHYSCSKCIASDRDRLYALYFNKVVTEKR